MEGKEAETVLRWARDYHKRGLIGADALATIEAECNLTAPGQTLAAPATPESSATSQVLHGMGGALLGAAAIALVFLLDFEGPNGLATSAWMLAGLGLVAVAAGFGILYGLKREGLADAGFIAGMLCLVVAPWPDRTAGQVLGPLALVTALAIPIIRRGSMVAAVASLAFGAALFASIERIYGEPTWLFSNIPDAAITLWLLVALAHLGFSLAGATALRQRWLNASLGIEAVAVVAPALGFVFAVVAPDHGSAFFDKYGGGEILLAALEGVLVAMALWFRHSELLVGAAAVISVDAIVFAFHVGGIEFGVVSLVIVAVAVLALANTMRKRWAGPARA